MGELIYRGHGIQESSSGPAYNELVLDHEMGLRHRCGNIVSAPSGWNADYDNLDKWKFQIEGIVLSGVPSRGSLAARKLGVVPAIDGCTSGASLPVRHFFLGLMHPIDGSLETLVVAFPARRDEVTTLTLVILPMTLETLHVIPNLHSPGSTMTLEGLHDGKRTQLTFHLSAEAIADIQTRFARNAR
ncbi:hypothetical protein BA950_07765 [Erythrobacter sp. SAORIC-644]|uniref:hypothetical protein n=1 Tax=Erythrobacter sp. SAORIC-644 TaxID=1869314 RepID=UPI000C9FB57D|nr:hypothetical protein [Erythrobacter sp. SAORIC-644]PNQ76365.1 hypothetical protein BA950_07765 [Erythrobacter sp. SAORIC-644]